MAALGLALAALEAAFPDSRLSLEIAPAYMGDWLMRAGPDDQPLALLRPKTTADVALAMSICHTHGMAVVPQGGRTGLTGGATPVKNALLISLEWMNHVAEPDRVSQTLVVDAGVPLQRIQEIADAAGLMFPLDIGSRGSCQIGGNLSTNAGGNRVLRYGMARDLVLGLEVVLADGTVVSAMNEMMKNNSGYDLKQIFIGSEGTLGIITRAVLKLVAKPHAMAVALCGFESYTQLEHFLTLTRAKLGGNLTAFEAMWPEFYRFAVAKRTAPLSADYAVYALIEVSTTDDSAEMQAEALIELAFSQSMVVDAVVAKSLKQSQELWAIRDMSGDLLQEYNPIGNFDVSVPTSSINDFVADCRAQLLARFPNLDINIFGHVVDGNLHIMAGKFLEKDAKELDGIVYQAVQRHRGSISAEHGIGLYKRDHLHLSRTAAEIALMRQLKTSFDPANILNPGKVILV
jgi:FAD/FMN-containing dehydrogenase